MFSTCFTLIITVSRFIYQVAIFECYDTVVLHNINKSYLFIELNCLGEYTIEKKHHLSKLFLEYSFNPQTITTFNQL